MRLEVFTSFSYSYLNRARVLAASLRRHHPEARLTAVLVDAAPDGFRFDPANEPFDRVLTTDEIVGNRGPGWLFCHNVVEACTAVKGAALQRLLAEGADTVVYLDPDIAVFAPLAPALDALVRASIVLTPHQVEPNASPQAIRDNEITSLRLGVYNLGFLAVRRDATGLAFADWWAARLDEMCYDEPERGLFVDQKWCDLIPCLFDRVAIVRDAGMNVASWNLSRRRVAFDGTGEPTVNGVPLRFFHFTKLGPAGETMTRRYAGDNLEVHELWAWYRREVERATDPAIPAGWWAYASYADGTRIAQAERALYRSRRDLRAAFANPFATGSGTFRDWLARHADELAA